MTPDLEALVVAAYVFADEYPVPARGGRRPLVSDAELVALAVAQAAIGISSDRQFLGLIGRVLPGWFPQLPHQSQYNRRLRALVGLISIVQQRLARWLDEGGIRLADGSQLAVANYAGCARRSSFAGFARYGYARSQHRYIWGVRLVLLTDSNGVPLGYTITPANEHEFEPLADLLTGTPTEIVIADKAFWGHGGRQRLAADGTRLLTPDKTRTAANPRARAHARLQPAHNRERLRQPQRPDAPRAPPRQDPSRSRRPHRPAHPRAHHRHPAQQTQRPPARALAAYDGR
jgi:IS5 family transposase